MLCKLSIAITKLERKDKMVYQSLADHLWLVSINAIRERFNVDKKTKHTFHNGR